MDVKVGHSKILLELLGILADPRCPCEKDKLLSKAKEALAREALHLIESGCYITSICQANSYRQQRHLQVDCRDFGVKPLTSPIQLWPVPINKANIRLGQLTDSPDLCFNNQLGSRGKCSATNEVCQRPFICSPAGKKRKKLKEKKSSILFGILRSCWQELSDKQPCKAAFRYYLCHKSSWLWLDSLQSAPRQN